MAKESFKVALPGRIYQKNNRRWWKVKLVGEKKAKPRALRPAGSRFATTGRDVAEEVARKMWELAIEAETAARVRAEAEARADAEPKLIDILGSSTRTATCECRGKIAH